MHRTTTTAALLVTVAVSALSGCMTVHYPPAPGAAAPSPPPPSPSPSAERPIVQAPAREALALIGPSREPAPTPSAARAASPATPPPVHRPSPPRSHPHPRAEHREPRRVDVDAPRQPRVEHPGMPAPVRPAVPKNSDVCALGRKYGGWRADSPESAICDQTYGH